MKVISDCLGDAIHMSPTTREVYIMLSYVSSILLKPPLPVKRPSLR